MAKTLKYGLETVEGRTGMVLDVPTHVFDTARSLRGRFAEAVGRSAQRAVIVPVALDDGVRLRIDTAKAGRSRGTVEKCDEIVQALEDVSQTAHPNQKDPNLDLILGRSGINSTDRLGTVARVRRPRAEDWSLQSFVTATMRWVADDLRYGDKRIRTELVYSQIDTPHGMVLQTNDMGSCSMDTDGMRYDPTSTEIQLTAHNLYAHSQQLVCLGGLVAIAEIARLTNPLLPE